MDPDFADALDGLILVDLTGTEPKLLQRYLGKTDSAAFLAYHNHRPLPDGRGSVPDQRGSAAAMERVQ